MHLVGSVDLAAVAAGAALAASAALAAGTALLAAGAALLAAGAAWCCWWSKVPMRHRRRPALHYLN